MYGGDARVGGRVCGRVYGYIRTFARPSVHPCVQKNRSYFCKIDLILKNRIYFGMYVQLHGRTYTHPRTRPYTRPRTRAPVRTFVRTPVRTPVHPPVHLSACLHARRKFTRSYHTLARARKTSHPRQIHHCTTPSIFIIYIYIYMPFLHRPTHVQLFTETLNKLFGATRPSLPSSGPLHPSPHPLTPLSLSGYKQ